MILDEIAAKTRLRVEERKQLAPLDTLKERVSQLTIDYTYPFEKALMGEQLSFICEVKKASPSKGVIAENFPYIDIAKDYKKAGASAVSVLTEPFWFKGEDKFLTEISKEISLPVLRKDFVVDEYMIYEAKLIGASAVLLIAAILTDSQIKEYLSLCKDLGLSALCEAHTEEEVSRLVSNGAEIVGVNNRDLKTFKVDISTAENLRKAVPQSLLFVAESGIKTPEDIKRLHDIGTNAVLIGETFMRSENKDEMLKYLTSEI